jgi:CRISPR-associated protein Cas1
VSLGSERLDATAKIDLVEVRSQSIESATEDSDLFATREVCPVDYKAGAPREGEDGKELWEADKMQLGVQCLLLRDNGYLCNEGIIYYRATKQHVRLAITPELESWILQKIGDARACAAGPVPPPLIDSPKCPRCSLVTVCLPDETRMLGQRSSGGALAAHRLLTRGESATSISGDEGVDATIPRRLIAARDDTRALYLNTPGMYVGRSGEVLQVKLATASPCRGGQKKELVQEVRINDLCHVALFGNIQISTAAVQALCDADVPVTYFSMG